MSASYPTAIKTFVPKRDLLDDVEASHINDIQDEIASLETTLGLNPTQDTTLVNPVNTWGTVGDRLGFMQRRLDIPYANLYRQAAMTVNSDVYTKVPFPAPLVDTHGLFNGSSGFKIKRRGVYLVVGQMRFNPTTLKGLRQIDIMHNGGSMVVQGVPSLTGTAAASNIWLNASQPAVLGVGDTVDMSFTLEAKAWGLPAGKFSAQMFGLSIFMVRDI